MFTLICLALLDIQQPWIFIEMHKPQIESREECKAILGLVQNLIPDNGKLVSAWTKNEVNGEENFIVVHDMELHTQYIASLDQS